MSAPLYDQAARERIRFSLDESLLVEAAAGTGKTTVLIERLVEVLATGRTTVDQVVAVTFTRKAAGELELRLRQELDRARAGAAGERRARLTDAIARLEEAKIGTLHSFCAEILRARPVEAGIDPAFAELDEEAEAALFERVFRGFLERQLEKMPEGLRRILARLAEADRGDSPFERLLYAARELAGWRDFPAPGGATPSSAKRRSTPCSICSKRPCCSGGAAARPTCSGAACCRPRSWPPPPPAARRSPATATTTSSRRSWSSSIAKWTASRAGAARARTTPPASRGRPCWRPAASSAAPSPPSAAAPTPTSRRSCARS